MSVIHLSAHACGCVRARGRQIAFLFLVHESSCVETPKIASLPAARAIYRHHPSERVRVSHVQASSLIYIKYLISISLCLCPASCAGRAEQPGTGPTSDKAVKLVPVFLSPVITALPWEIAIDVWAILTSRGYDTARDDLMEAPLENGKFLV